MIRRPRAPMPEDRDRAVRLAVYATDQVAEATRTRDAAIAFALTVGADQREISAATGVPLAHVKRIAARVKELD